MTHPVTSTTAAAATTAVPTAPPPTPDPGSAVELRGVGRRFGAVPALADLDLRVPTGQITVLLGPNGAGKTTAIRVITGALEPDDGDVRVFGLDPLVDGEEIRRRCGVVSAKPALYDRLSGRANLQYAAELYGLGRKADGPIHDAADRFGIVDALDQQVGGYSTGMKTRLALARSVLHDPDLLLFDEPTSGLDPESSHAVLELIREMTAGGRTVVMCTHLLIEAEGLADRIVVLDAGTDLLAGTQAELTGLYWPPNLVHLAAEDPRSLDGLEGSDGVLAYRPDADGRPGVAEVQLDDLTRLPDLIARLVAHGVRLTRVEPHDPTLEDLYFAVRRDHRERLAAEGRSSAAAGLAPVLAPHEGTAPAAPPPPRTRIDLAEEDGR
ncbi:ABC transporter ATP-binding protein [Rhabdothermincola salaria]|uniref:ABC transporter ATP-binding protein n=1 Tax=Rhabdothermincola salaria TaxID=2903142 RepID=UPI001E2EEBC7|nr:ABC transporter ATP-binding protein [Rhabdothermincola salaria]MCD9622625.1 ABC transporter ATP-binding protein [Rhabdothermincola salaria]